MGFFRLQDQEGVEMLPGVIRRAVWLDHVMITFFNFEPHTAVPDHDHPHEQISYVIEGALEFTLGEETQILQAGVGVCVPPNVRHGARVLDEPAVVLDAWHPVREDYKA